MSTSQRLWCACSVFHCPGLILHLPAVSMCVCVHHAHVFATLRRLCCCHACVRRTDGVAVSWTMLTQAFLSCSADRGWQAIRCWPSKRCVWLCCAICSVTHLLACWLLPFYCQLSTVFGFVFFCLQWSISPVPRWLLHTSHCDTAPLQFTSFTVCPSLALPPPFLLCVSFSVLPRHINFIISIVYWLKRTRLTRCFWPPLNTTNTVLVYFLSHKASIPIVVPTQTFFRLFACVGRVRIADLCCYFILLHSSIHSRIFWRSLLSHLSHLFFTSFTVAECQIQCATDRAVSRQHAFIFAMSDNHE